MDNSDKVFFGVIGTVVLIFSIMVLYSIASEIFDIKGIQRSRQHCESIPGQTYVILKGDNGMCVAIPGVIRS